MKARRAKLSKTSKQAPRRRTSRMPQRARPGESHGMARLSERQVAEARRRLAQLPLARRGPEIEKLAQRFGVARSTVSDAAAGVTWSYMDSPPPIKRERRHTA